MRPQTRDELGTRLLRCALPLLAVGVCAAPLCAQRIQDVARVEGIRKQQLSGIGLVTGLAGTGDSSRNEVTRRLYANLLKHLSVEVDAKQLRSRNVAAVIVTADVETWTQVGSPIEVNVTSIGDAKSLAGGWLLETTLHFPMTSPGGEGAPATVALAQGRVSVADGVATVGRGTATLEYDISYPVHADMNSFRVLLDRPDFSSAAAVVSAINEFPYLRFVAADELPLAHADDLGSVTVRIPRRFREAKRVIGFISKIMSEVELSPKAPDAKVVIDRRTGAISVNGSVRVGPVAIVHQGLEIRIGTADVLRSKKIDPGPRKPLLLDVMDALEQKGIAPADMPSIIRLIHESGALIGKLVER